MSSQSDQQIKKYTPSFSKGLEAAVVRSRRLRVQAAQLGVEQFVWMQRSAGAEQISLIGASPTAKRDEVLLIFKTIFDGREEFFTGILYLTKRAAAGAEIIGAWYREVQSKARSYWVNAEWGSWSLDVLVADLCKQGLTSQLVDSMGLHKPR